ncbi:hypothetical protein [Lysinibacillus endophyticus]|uniref:hypothetical protein n=2 Tax=Ureibacillus endophyticus TaxID=1978490 RepID=UPI0031365226
MALVIKLFSMGKVRGDHMPAAIIVLVLAIISAIFLSRGKTNKRKFLIWGIATIIIIAPLLSWVAGILFGIGVGDGFAGMTIMIYGFVFLEVVGFSILYFGIFNREKLKDM